MKISNVLPVILLLCVLTTTQASEKTIQFDYLTFHDGLSDQTIRCIIQDHIGYMWFGTNNGLNRYDGNEIIRYYNDKSSHTNLKGSIIYCLYEDSKKNLWIGTWGGGLSRYNREQDNFINYTHDPGDLGSIRHNDVWSIYEDSRGNLWITTQKGLERYDYETNTFEKHLDELQISGESVNLRREAFSAMTEGPDGSLWIAIWKYGILQYDAQSRNLIRHLVHDPNNKNSLSTNEINVLFTDKESRIWVGPYKGALECIYVNNNNLYFDRYFKGNSDYTLSDDRINFIFQDRTGLIWIGTEWGLNVLDKKSKIIRKYFYDADQDYSLTSNHMWSGYINQNGIIWVGTHEAGLNIYDPYKRRFSQSFPYINKAKVQDKRFVKSIFSDSENNLWIGTDYGLNKVSMERNIIKTYTHNPAEPMSLDIGGVSGIVEDFENNIWVGTWGGGIHKMNKSTGKFKRYGSTHVSLSHKSLSDPNIRTMALDRSGKILIGTSFGYLDIFDPQKEDFQHFLCLDVDSLRGAPVVAICPDIDGSIWLGMSENGGVLHFDPRKKTSRRFFHHYEDPEYSLSSNDILSLLNDGDKIWIGTKNGLNLLEKETGQVVVFNEKHGLPDKSILSIKKDDSGFLWLSTIKGLSKFDLTNEIFYNYDDRDGALSNCNISWKDKNGKLYFGGINGILCFDPPEIINNPFLAPTVFSMFSIFNDPVLPGMKGSPLDKHINHSESIILSHAQNSFSIEFSALNYTLPEKNQYKYRLEGFDQDWVYAGTRRIAYYTNVNPGHYTFSVIGSNNDGIWNQDPKSIKLRVLPPPWKTWWAFSLYFIFIMGLLVIMRMFIASREKLESQLVLEKIEHEKITELSKRNDELHEMKIRFFTNISHEFRTPLTLILGPLEQIHGLTQNENIKSAVVLMQRNAQRLLRLINQLLDLSKIEAGHIKVELTKNDVVGFVQTVFNAFILKANRMMIDYKFSSNVSSAWAYLDEDKLEKILYNLISNAFKYTPSGGRIEVALMIAYGNESSIDNSIATAPLSIADSITLTVTDSGKGIPTADKQKVFDYFYQPIDTRCFNSSGLGLSLVHELVKLLKGSVEVKDIPGQPGTRFLVRIPTNREAYKGCDISHAKTKIGVHIDDISLTETPIQQNTKLHTFDAEPIACSNQPLVLIVEDNQDVREFIRNHLTLKYKIIEAKDGNDGIEKAQENIPDLIISDIMMPCCNGYELNQVIKSDVRTSHIPVILLTAKSDLTSQIEGIKLGADDYITKPFQMEYLISRVENLIESRKTLRRSFGKKFYLDSNEITSNSLDNKFMKKLITLIEENIDNDEFGVDDIVRQVAMSRAQLYRKLKAITNQTVNDFIQQVRLNKAARYILEKNKSISEITYMVGFKDPSYFTKCFRKQFDCLPTEFTKKYCEQRN